MREVKPQDKLVQAAQLIRSALADLDLAHTKCGGCGHTKHHNRAHWDVSKRFEETPTKLMEAARLLDNG